MDYKRLPYGVADYTWIKSQNNYCTDKTMFIPKMEEAGDFLYLIRPRRFGKSVFLTMLQAYYDIEKKDSFHTTFKDTWIESHPTEGLGKYQVFILRFFQSSGWSWYFGRKLQFILQQRTRWFHQKVCSLL